MKIDLTRKNSKAKLGDIIYSKASAWHYLIAIDIEHGNKFRGICLEESEITKSFNTIEELCEKHFDKDMIEVISRDSFILIRE